MIPESSFPNLDVTAGNRNTAVVLARSVAGQLTSPDPVQLALLRTFASVVDGAILDYSLMRSAYYRFFSDPKLGNSEAPVSALLIPYLSHTENCISNAHRSLSFYEAVRDVGTSGGGNPLVRRHEWKAVASHAATIRALRDAVQHADKDLRRGTSTGGRVRYIVTGELVAGQVKLRLVDLAATLTSLHEGAELALSRA